MNTSGPGHNTKSPLAKDILKQFVDSIEHLEEEKKEIADEISAKYQHAKSMGFDVKVLRHIVKLRKLTKQERDEHQDLLDCYMSALGMLADTPLGDWAVKKVKNPHEVDDDEDDGDSSDDAPDRSTPPPTPKANSQTDGKTVDDAREMGATAAKAGKPVTSNPFPPRDPRRAAWDGSWCREMGSDGLDIPDEFRRKDHKKKGAA